MKTFQFRLLALLLAIACGSFLFVACNKDKPAEELISTTSGPDLSAHFRQWRIVTLDIAQLYDQAKKAKAGAFARFELENGSAAPWQLTAVQHELFAQGFETSEIGQSADRTAHALDLVALEGSISGQRFDECRLVVSPEYAGGFVVADGATNYVMPLSLYDKNAAKNQYVVYREEDIVEEVGTCIEPAVGTAAPPPTELPSGIGERSATCWKMEIRAHSDYEYFANKAGGNYNLGVFAIAVALNNADAKFSAINLDFSVLEITLLTAPSNPLYYPTSSNIGTLVQQTKNFWNFFLPNVNRDAVILFTGKNSTTPSGTIGQVDDIGVVCSALTKSYAVVKWGSGNNQTFNTVAHEVGHLLMARHPNNDSQSWCYPTLLSASGIMGSAVPTSSTAAFITCSRNEMNWHLWFNHGCLTQGGCN